MLTAVLVAHDRLENKLVISLKATKMSEFDVLNFAKIQIRAPLILLILVASKMNIRLG